MSIVLKENEWAKKKILEKDLGKKPSETLSRVARYYIDLGYGVEDVRNMLEGFLLSCDPVASIPKWDGAIDYAISRACKHPAVCIEYIGITDNEIAKINSLEGAQIRRLAFTLLCLGKYWKEVTGNKDYWVNNKDNEIMAMANINTSIKRQSKMYWDLNQNGMIRFSRKVDNTNVAVCFVEPGDVVLKIDDFRNLGYQYLKYLGGPYFECVNCGITTKYSDPVKGRKQKYCKSCANEIAIQQRVNSVMRRRSHN